MHLYMLLLLLGCRASSYFLPLKEKPSLQEKTATTIIEEMLCLLEAEKTPLHEKLATPTCVQNLNCARNNTDEFIHELNRLNKSACMKIVREDMRKLRENCSVLQKKSTHANSCTEITADFAKFREKLEEFLIWLSQMNNCRSIVREVVDPDLSSKCSCPHLREHHWERLQERLQRGWQGAREGGNPADQSLC